MSSRSRCIDVARSSMVRVPSLCLQTQVSVEIFRWCAFLMLASVHIYAFALYLVQLLRCLAAFSVCAFINLRIALCNDYRRMQYGQIALQSFDNQ